MVSISAPCGVVAAYSVGITSPAESRIGLKRALPSLLGLNESTAYTASCTRYMTSPAPHDINLASRDPAGGAIPGTALAMLYSSHLVLRRCDDTIRIDRQHVLRTPVIKKAVQGRKPEGQPPAVLRIAEYAQDLRHLFAGAVV